MSCKNVACTNHCQYKPLTYQVTEPWVRSICDGSENVTTWDDIALSICLPYITFLSRVQLGKASHQYRESHHGEKTIARLPQLGFPKPIDWYIYPFYGIQVVLHLKCMCSSGLALVACTVQSRYLCQFWLSVNWIRGNKRQWNVSIHAPSLIQENACENVVCKVLDILFLPHRVKSIIVYSLSHTWRNSSVFRCTL